MNSQRVMAYSVLVSLFLMCLMFAACERIQQVVVPGEQPTVAPSESESDTDSESDSEETIKIGMIWTAPLPGTTVSGVELAVSQINAAGGIKGKPVTLITKEDGNDTQRSLELFEELVAEGIVGLIGPDWARHAVHVGPLAQQHQIPMVAAYPTNPRVTEAGDFVFLSALTDAYQAKLLAKFATETLKAKTAALLTEERHEPGEAYSAGLSRFFSENFTALGGEVVAQQFYVPGDTDFTTQLTAINEAAPDVVFIPGFIAEVAAAVQQGKETLGMTATFLGGDGWDHPALITKGGAAVENTYFVSQFWALPITEQTPEEAKKFVAAYNEMFGTNPKIGAAMAYDAFMILAQAIARAENLTGPAIREQIAATTDYRGAIGLSSYDENRHPIKRGAIHIVKNGQIQQFQVIAP